MSGKLIKKAFEFLTQPKITGSLVFLITLILLTSLLSSRYYLFNDLVENGKANRDIIAPKTITIIDKNKTEQQKYEIAQKAVPILIPIQDYLSVNKSIRNNLEDTLNSIKNIRNSKNTFAEKKEKINEILDISKEKQSIDASIVYYLLKCSKKSFEKIEVESAQTLNKVLNDGLSEEQLLRKSNEIINKNIKNYLSETQKLSINFLVKKVLQPNRIVDENTTELARKNLMKAVKPITITFTKGSKIVKEGEAVTKIQFEALKKMGFNVSQIDLIGIMGICSLVGLCMYIMFYYVKNFENKFSSFSYYWLMSLLAISITIFAVFLPLNVPVYIIPIPAISILIAIFTNSRISLVYTTAIVIILSMSLQYDIKAIAVFLIGGMIATFMADMINYYRRIDLVKAGLDIGLIQSLTILSLLLLQNSIDPINISLMTADVASSFTNGLICGMIALGTLPLIESTFKIITPYGLAELADHNQALLKRLQFEAPGTYHHSLMVSNLAEAAAEAINANPILARVGAFYHDIGKLKRPLFFVENQSYFGIENPHDKLNPRLSKMVITTHPKDGVEIAKEYKLPAIVHQFISQHHGNGIATYFYQQALKEEGPENISKEQFRYTGPKPSSKEAAILMLADAAESAVRSIKNPTPEATEEVIDKIIKERLMDNQLSESNLTQKDLKIIALTFNRILRGMQHHRIKYHENMLEALGKKNENSTIQIPNNLIQKNISDKDDA